MAVIDNDWVTGKYKIDGVNVADPIIPYKFELNTTGVWYRNLNADRIGYVVANMKKLYWAYTGLPKVYAEEILTKLYAKLESGSDLFTVESYVLGKGQVIDKYYLGQPFVIESAGPGLYKIDIHWIQDKGKKTL